jgi:secreted trypsin-like serine protease
VRVWAVALAAVVLLGAAAPRRPSPVGPTIFHGTLVDPAKWTYYASITSRDQAGSAHRTISCGAVVVAPTTVLTASHCVTGTGSTMAVAVGTGINPHIGGEVIGVRHVVLAPDADPATFSHDVAVLVLDHAVPGSVVPVAVATPADDATMLAGGARVEVAGVGQTDNVDPSSAAATELRSAAMEVTPAGSCKVEIENGSRAVMNNDEFCTNGVPGTDRHTHNVGDPCYGDSGGPIVSLQRGTPVLVGLVSTGTAQCATGSDIQPRLSAFASFLKRYLPATPADHAPDGPSRVPATARANPTMASAAPGAGRGGTWSTLWALFTAAVLAAALVARIVPGRRKRGDHPDP